jgi:hypothetical protein
MNVAHIVEVRNAHTVLVGNPKWRRSCWRKFRWKGIKMRLSESAYQSVGWVEVHLDRGRLIAVADTVINLRLL